MRLLLLACLIPLLSPGAENSNLLLQHPTLSRTQIVFVYAGDLWSVAREGGEAIRLTTGAGVETTRSFRPTARGSLSPANTTATWTFSCARRGRRSEAAHVASRRPIPSWAGRPTASGFCLYRSRTAYSRFSELFTIQVEGGLPETAPLPMGFEGSYSPDGSSLAYSRCPRVQQAWKRYRGGDHHADLDRRSVSGRVEKVPRENSNDFNPMWVGDKVYFLSDREGPVTLYSYDTRSKKVNRAIRNDGLDFKSACAGPGAIVYEQFGALHLYDLKSGKTKPVRVTIRRRPSAGARRISPMSPGACATRTSRPRAHARCLRLAERS